MRRLVAQKSDASSTERPPVRPKFNLNRFLNEIDSKPPPDSTATPAAPAEVAKGSATSSGAVKADHVKDNQNKKDDPKKKDDKKDSKKDEEDRMKKGAKDKKRKELTDDERPLFLETLCVCLANKKFRIGCVFNDALGGKVGHLRLVRGRVRPE